MSDTPVKVVVDLSKPAGERESIVPLTPEEIAEREQMAIQAQAEQEARDAKLAAEAAAKASALNKLKALGLTEAEAKALVGA
jgi:sugar-specific transcriptional regulator TrmB